MPPHNYDEYVDILHFNDVYHIEEGRVEPVGGAARFKGELSRVFSTLKRDAPLSTDEPLVLFSGDAFNPSTQSTITKGSHMDFDFGVPVLEDLAKRCNFPWLLSNIAVDEQHPDTPLAKAKRYLIFQRGGMKIGVIGLAEKEWLLTIPSLPPNYHYRDFEQVGIALSRKLRDEHGVDLVIALTHMRLPNDEALAQACQREIDLILGGHDHFFHVGSGCDLIDELGNPAEALPPRPGPSVPDLRVVKSGTDFRTFSHVRLTRTRKVSVTRYAITKAVQSDMAITQLVEEAQRAVDEKLQVIIGYRDVAWDTRSESVRLGESAVGNFVADIFLSAHPEADMALLCGGALRSDTVYPPGPVTLGEILAILPFDDPVVMLSLTGEDLIEALEASVAMYPKQEGRFPQVSGLELTFDPSATPGHRVVELLLTNSIKPEPIVRNRSYSVVTRNYMALGFDGFDALKRGKYVVDEENGMMASTLVRRFFLGLKYSALLAGKAESSPVEAAVRLWRQNSKVGKGLAAFRQCICTSVLSPPGDPEANVESPCSCLDARLRPYVTVSPKLEGRISQFKNFQGFSHP
ncbi:hypothetical protein L0F63_004273 [Massospora cicadina]|nr:hypothetical protein L0F63_004273 [Massospora cicadina]